MSSQVRPKLANMFHFGKPKLAQIESFINKAPPKKVTKLDINREKTKLGDFICILIILGFICYFIFFIKKPEKRKVDKQITQSKLEQIKQLNYEHFNIS